MMSPAQFNIQNGKKEMINALSPLKINRDSHFIKKSSPSSSSSSSTSTSTSLVNGIVNVTNKSPPRQRHPVIIYTHSPKIIHTHPKDFMALVQKLTGLSRSDEDQINNLLPPQTKVKQNHDHDHDLINDNNKSVMINDDDESTSVVTDEIENNASSNTTLGENMAQVNSSFVPPPPPVFDPPNPCFNNIPVFNPNSSTDFWCTSQPFYNYSDSFFCMPNMRSSLPSPNVEGMKELPDF